MLEFIKGATVSGAEVLHEGYEAHDNWIIANIHASKIRKIIDDFIQTENTPLYCLFLEVPSNLCDEKILKEATEGAYGQLEATHMDVYYLDGVTKEDLLGLLDLFNDILIHDGMSSFGVLSQRGNEIGKYKNNIMRAYSHSGDLRPFVSVFQGNGVPEQIHLQTAWDLINSANPGISEKYCKNGKTIYDVVEVLKEVGMYKAEQREG